MAFSLTRRGFFGSSLGVFLAQPNEYGFHHDHVMGTSLDFVLHAASAEDARAAHAAVFDEIERLSKVLSTRDASSEVSHGIRSADLSAVLDAYEHWRIATGGAISAYAGKDRALNLDALGKAYIADAAADRAFDAGGVSDLLLNIGGDIVLRGSLARTIGVADPAHPADNARPLTAVHGVRAIATSGTSERGAHLFDPRTGGVATGASSATVIAGDGLTANALATALCVLPAEEGLRLVDETRGCAALCVADGVVYRSARFASYERYLPASSPAGWPAGQEVSVTLTLKEIAGFRMHRPYVAVWAEDASGKLIRNIAVWANKPRWMPELHSWWSRAGGGEELFNITKPTRSPGRYRIVWDGLDDAGHPAAPGAYRITVETNREHGDYAKESGVLNCGSKPAKITLKGNGEFEDVLVEYGAKSTTT